MTIDIRISSRFDLETENIWRVFEREAAGYVFQTFDWLSHWQSTIGNSMGNIHPYIVTMHDRGSTRALVPLAIRTMFGVRILEFIGGNQADFMCPLLDPEWNINNDSFVRLWKKLQSQLPPVDVIHFKKQPPMIGEVRNPFLDLENTNRYEESTQLELPGQYEVFEEEILPKRVRLDLQRCRRRLAEGGPLRLIIGKSEGEVQELTKRTIQQKRERYRSMGVKDSLSDPAHRDFYEKMPRVIAEEGRIHCAALVQCDDLVATHWGVTYKDRYYYLMPAFGEEKWSRFSPGKLLLQDLIRWSIENQFRTFDFTIGGERYKKYWSTRADALYEHIKIQGLRGSGYRARTFLQTLKRQKTGKRYE